MDVYYAGIGSRKVPDKTYQFIVGVSMGLAARGYTLRSGGAKGCDTAFEEGCDVMGGRKEIYRPENIQSWWMDVAKENHPKWDKLTIVGKCLHARNTPIVLGPGEFGRECVFSHSSFVLCWTPGGATVGGTGQAIRIAASRSIPIFNLYEKDCLDNLKVLLQKIEQLQQ